MPIEKWTLEKVKEGFDRFFDAHNRYPAAYDVDDFDFLPSSRQIQRKFGGLVNLRKLLNLEIGNYTMGNEGSRKASHINIRGKKYENILLDFLKEQFDEKFIHIERPIGNDHKDRYDFFVYAKPTNFAVDVFCTNDTRGVVNIMNMKENKYKRSIIIEDLYFVYFGDNINDGRIKKWQTNRKNKFPVNWKIMNIEEFKKDISRFESFRVMP
jgi:hypothetical protein